jgi:NitT/TauT family transport system permease protein
VVRDLDAAGGGPREPSLGARWPLPPLPDSLAVERTLGVGARLWEAAWLRKAVLLVMLAAAWEAAARLQGNPLLLPTFTETARAFVKALGDGLGAKAWTSVWVLLKGYALGVTLALLLTGLAISFRLGRDLLGLLTAMLNPLPAIALLPVAMLWLGLGEASLVFVLVHAVLWPLALNALQGFTAVPETLRLVGRNYALSGPRYVALILIPAALHSLLAGLEIAWAFAWRTLIAAELVFGVSSGQGGLGWFIFQSRNELLTDRVFAGLATVILIGLAVENLVFRPLERCTVRRWGMVR